MAGMRMDSFGGMVPLVSRRLLPPNMATLAVNAYLRGGEIRGIRQPRAIKTFPAPGGGVPTYRKAVRVPDPNAPNTPVWVPLESRYADFFPNPLVNDAFNRFVWLDGNAPGTATYPRQNSLARLKNGDPSILLGVPAPALAPTLVATGGAAIATTRSYVYTYVNIFNEEGPPSPAALDDGFQDSTWAVTAMVNPAFAAERGIDRVRLYRTVTGSTGTAFFRVVEQPVATTAYNDTRTDSEVAKESLILASTLWAPPEDMEGIIAMPNGFFAGWRGKDIFFSEPYRPWAWPAEYVVSAEYDVIDCGVVDQTLVVLTATMPVFVTGTSPSAMSVSRSSVVAPCVEPNSIAQAPQGVFFASPSGLVLASSGGLANITVEVIDRDSWQNEFVPRIRSAVVFDSQYIVMSNNGEGFIFDPRGLQSGIIRLANFAAIENIWTDVYTDEAHLIVGNVVYTWSSSNAPFSVAEWISKEFQFPAPLNLGALLVNLDTRYATNIVPDALVGDIDPPSGSPWSDQSSILNYNRIHGAQINGAPAWGAAPPGNPTAAVWPYWFGVVYDDNAYALPEGNVCLISVFAGRELVWQALMQSGVPYRLPSGFKSDLWQFQVKTRVPVMNIQIAETVKGLANV